MVKDEDCDPQGSISYSKELRNRFVLSDKRVVHRPSSMSPAARLYRSCRSRQGLRDQDTLYEEELVQLGLDDDDHVYSSRSRRSHRSVRHVSSPRRSARPHSMMRSLRPQRRATQILEVSDRVRRSLRSTRLDHASANGMASQRSSLANGHVEERERRSSRRRVVEEEEEEEPDDDGAGDDGDDDGEEGEVDEEEVEEGADEEDSHEAEGVRRSTRRRKLLYDNFNTSWILGTQKLRGYPMFEDQQVSREDRKGDREECTSDGPKDGQEKQKKASIMEPNSDDRHEKIPGLHSKSASNRASTFYEDMYTRVKRHRRPPKQMAFQSKQRKGHGKIDGSGPDSQGEDSTSDDEAFENTSDEPEGQQVGEGVGNELGRGCRASGRTRSIKYRLRQNKPRVERFQVSVEPPRTRSMYREAANLIRTAGGAPSGRIHRKRRSRRHYRHHHWRKGPEVDSDSSSSSSSSASDRGDRGRGGAHPRNRCMPLNYSSLGRSEGVGVGGVGSKKAPADVDPMILDTSVRFEHVGGLESHIRCLKEIVVFPMLYKEIFEKFNIQPPKGVLFHGPPGTGKTLIARALANECSQGDRRVAFFMRKGADCLSKWVGESERQLRLLFEQAYQMRPSIIFFDELDGLAPVRSSRQDQIHASIVSTLLALMDGLDNRGEVVVIGATNRIDAIDPALRRPGRFDRELYFPLPARKERQEILQIHVSKWAQPPAQDLMSYLAEGSTGYCGSDLRALCSEAVIKALQRRYPQIYKSSQKLLLNSNSVQVEKCDFMEAKSVIVPASQRAVRSPAHSLSQVLQPLLESSLVSVKKSLLDVFPWAITISDTTVDDQENELKLMSAKQASQHPSRFILVGDHLQGQTTLLAPALLHSIDHMRFYVLDICTLFEECGRSPEEAVIQVFREAQRNLPSIIYMPNIERWWNLVPDTVHAVFLSRLHHLEPGSRLLLLATADKRFDLLPTGVSNLFSRYRGEVYTMQNPTASERENFFKPLLLEQTFLPPPELSKKADQLEQLPVAPPPEPPKLTDEQLLMKRQEEEVTLRELRIFLREICAKLARNRQFFMFTKPVDVEEVPDYNLIIKCPMDLETMMTKIDQHAYECARDFLADIDLICRNALEYNPDRDAADKLIRHRAYALRDTAYALIKAEMDSDFEDHCRDINRERKRRSKQLNGPGAEAKDGEDETNETDLNALYFPNDCSILSSTSKLEASSNSQMSVPSPLQEISNNHDAELSQEIRRSSRRCNDISLDHKDIEGSEGRPKKRRSTPGWARGFLRKAKKKKLLVEVKKEENGEESESKRTEDDDNSSTPVKEVVDGEINDKTKRKISVDQCSGVSSPDGSNKSVDGVREKAESCSERRSSHTSTPRPRSSLDGADHSNEKRKSIDSDEPENKCVTGLDKECLKQLVQRAVQVTEGKPVETIHELYIQLEKCIGQYACQWKRNGMLKSLEGEISRFVECVR